MIILDCEDRESAIRTVAGILGLGTANLRQRVGSFEYWDRSGNPFEVDLFHHVVGNDELWPTRFAGTFFFHLTRAIDTDGFKKGLLPLPIVLEEIWSQLRALVSDDEVPPERWREMRLWLEGASDDHFAHLYRLKVADKIHWGPHGILVLDTAFTEAAGLHDYLKTPEIVEDITMCCRDLLGIDLLNRFHQSSLPCVVKFRTTDTRRSLLETALVYVHAIVTGTDIGRGCNEGFSAQGSAILPKDIASINVLPTP